MKVSMPSETHHKPRVGVPWRTSQEEAEDNRAKMENYLRGVREAGGEPILISLTTSTERERLVRTLDAVVLPGSSADVAPNRYGVSKRHPRTADPDAPRERTDYALLRHAFAGKAPVLAICYGVQLLNVYLGGTLLQDIASELHTEIRHDKKGLAAGAADPVHSARIEAGSKLAGLAGKAELAESGFSAYVNSSHHQSILTPGRGLHITARAPDGVVEAVEWTGDANWVVGVQWHPERMKDDPLAKALFRELIAAARGVTVRG